MAGVGSLGASRGGTWRQLEVIRWHASCARSRHRPL